MRVEEKKPDQKAEKKSEKHLTAAKENCDLGRS
jgi:hypothetical protein